MTATVTCPRCTRRVVASDDGLGYRVKRHVDGRGKICERSGSEVRHVTPIKGVAS